MAEGVVTPEQMSIDGKLHSHTTRVIDLSATDTAIVAVYDALREIAIESIELLYVTETAAAASTLDIGIISDTDAIVDSYSTSASATVADSNNVTLPLATTLRQTSRWPAMDKPILPAGTRCIITHTASGGAGEIQLVFKYYYLSRQTTNA